jgi:HSP20 family protein
MSNQPLDFWRNKMESPVRDIDRFLNDWWGVPSYSKLKNELNNFNPSCEITENKTHYLAKFDLPGINKDQIKIDLHDNVLTVSGERKEERKEDDKDNKRHVSEVFYGSFMRSFTLPVKVDPEKVDAKYDAGVLTIAVPKQEPAKARQITVK